MNNFKPKSRKSKPKPIPSKEQVSHKSNASFERLRQQSYAPGKRRHKTRRFFYDKRWSTRKKKVYWIVVSLLAIGLLSGGYYAYRISTGASGIFQGSFLDSFRRAPLETDQYGRSNTLILSTTEDDENQSASLLTDSLIVISIDQETKQGNLISIPRDLWVEYPEPCAGQAGKVNAVFACALRQTGSEDLSAIALSTSISQVIGTDIHYYVRVNQTVLRDLVDSVGGITVTIESSDPRGIYDVATGLSLPNGPVELNGEQALDLSRARNSKGGYGLPRSNFDREQNQQKVIRAIQRQALNTGTLTNPGRVIGIADSLGDNVRSSFESNKIRTLIDIARGTDTDNLVTIDLADRESPLTITGQVAGQSIVLPTAGLFNYSQIHEAIREHFQQNHPRDS